jgi:hypothetical protein
LIPSLNQRMFHGGITSSALADQLAARFNDRQHHIFLESKDESSLLQIGSKHGTPVTINISDTIGGVLVTMSRDSNWLDKLADAGDIFERAASNPISLIASIPDIAGELSKVNLSPQIWNAIADICALTQSLAGEINAPKNPIICGYCRTINDPGSIACISCGGDLQIQLSRVCPKCQHGYTSEALFCQSCGTRLIEG